jgi:ADP-ribose pyrophosphatase YjhB (NUDIX family)
MQNYKSGIKGPKWGFPKGRKRETETEEECADREFKEETKLDTSTLDYEGKSFIEVFKGSNGKSYSTKYFLAKSKYLFPTTKIELNTINNGIRQETVSEELSDLEWVTYEEACRRLSNERQAILNDVMEIILKK